MKKPLQVPIVFAIATIVSTIAAIGNKADTSVQEVMQFVLKRYDHGIPLADADQFAATATPVLISMLGDLEHKNYWNEARLILNTAIREYGGLDTPVARNYKEFAQAHLDLLEKLVHRHRIQILGTSRSGEFLAPGSQAAQKGPAQEAEPPPQTSVEDVKHFVSKKYRHGLPILEAEKFPKAASPMLVIMLHDEDLKEFWANIVLTIGIIGDPEGVDALITHFQSRFHGEIDQATYRSVASVPLALGHAAYKNNEAALDYIVSCASVEGLNEKGISWVYRGESTAEQRFRWLVAPTTLGLAVSGRDKAREALKELINVAGRMNTPFGKRLEEASRGALDFMEKVMKDGRKKVIEDALDAQSKAPHWNGFGW
jgi:hypothetical protein